MKKLWGFGFLFIATVALAVTPVGVPFPLTQFAQTYQRTAAEITAGVTPVSFGYAPGNVFRFMTPAQITDVTSGTHSLDDTSAIQNALNVGGSIYLPCFIFRAASGLTQPGGTSFQGMDCPQGSPASNTTATIQCDLAVATCLSVGAVGSTNGHATLRNMKVWRAAGSIPASSIGILVQNLYNVGISNVMTMAHDVGIEFLGNGTCCGISAQVERLYTCNVTTAHLDLNTWAELRIINSRLGCNGSADQTPATYMKIEGGSTTNAAAGPNTLFVANTQFNQGANTAGCWLDFVNQLPASIADMTEWSFVNVHVEAIGTAYICSDATWTTISRLKISNSHFNTNKPFLSLNVATTANDWEITGNYFAGSFTLAPTNQWNFVGSHNNDFLQAVSLTGVSATTYNGVGNIYRNGLTHAGAFASSSASVGEMVTGGSFTGTATGIFYSGDSWLGPAAPTLAARLTSGTSRTTTTFTDESQLHISLLSGHTYRIRGLLFWLCTANSTGLKWNYTYSGTQSLFVETDNFATGAGGGTPAMNTQASSLPFGSTEATCGTTAGQFNSAVLDGIITTTSAGTLSLQDAQAIAGGTTTVQIGTYLEALPIG